jgi:hypothetical protein
MRVAPIVLSIFGAMLASSEAVAATYSSSHFSKIIATATVPDRDNPQLYFSVRAGTLRSGEMDQITPSDGIYYQYSGTVEIKIGIAGTILYAQTAMRLPGTEALLAGRRRETTS